MADHAGLERLLSPEERSARQRFLREADRRAYAANRGLLRSLLGRYLSMDPASVPIRRGPHGKPELVPAADSGPVHFSLAHTRGLSLFAFTRLGGVGVDVERIDPGLDPERCAAWIRLPAARARLLAFPDTEKLAAFYSAWTAQEAWAKALGPGLGPVLDAPEGGNPMAPAGLTLVTLDAGPGYAAALAAPGPDFSLSFMGRIGCHPLE